MTRGRRCLPLMSLMASVLAIMHALEVESFQPTSFAKGTRRCCGGQTYFLSSSSLDESELKIKLAEYLKKRKEANADDAAKAEVGKVIGGTRGNAVLEFVSGAPNKERQVDEAPEVFDYDELSKYGFSDLLPAIMENGGRRAMYKLMDMDEPAIPSRITTPKKYTKLVIDRTGETDGGRYSGLQMSTLLDDDEMGRALDEAQRKTREGKRLGKKIAEEDYVMPFADKRNVGPKQTPLWTPEKLDEVGKQAGEVQAWARRERLNKLKRDENELLEISGELRVYSIFAAVTCALAYGRATPNAASLLGLDPSGLDALQIPALALIAASIGSAVVNAALLAPPKRRSSAIWGVKGLMGGPLAIRQLRELDDLQTFGELEQ